MLVLLAFLYWSTAAYMLRQADATIEAEIDVFAERYRVSGLAGLTALIRERLARQPVGAEIYLLARPDSIPVVGNLSAWPPVVPDEDGWLVFRLAEAGEGREAEVHDARARPFRLQGGYRLLVGRDMHELDSIQSRILRAMVSGLAVTALLGLGGAVLMSWTWTRRIAAINAAVAEIMAGDLSRRLPAEQGGDDFSRLVASLNRMLERIDGLMTGVRHVSDSIAHDLRTPLQRLRNRLEVLALESAAPESDGEGSGGETLAEALAEADGLLDTFNALLRIARIEAGERRAGFAEVSLGELVRDVVELYEPVAEERGQHLAAELEAEPVVEGDRDLLFQAVANLVDNALKYTPAEGHVRVEVGHHDGRAEIAVADDGPGIAPEERQNVFRRFYRLDPSRTTPGNGLGLSLVAAVAKVHGLDVRLEDNRPGLRVVLDWPAPGRVSGIP